MLYAEDIRRYRLLGDPVPLEPEGQLLFAAERRARRAAEQAEAAPPAGIPVVTAVRPPGVPAPPELPQGDPRTALREGIAALPAARERVEQARRTLVAADRQIGALEEEVRTAADADEKQAVGLTERMRHWLTEGGDRPEPPPAAPERLSTDVALRAARDARRLLVSDVSDAERQHDIAERAIDAAVLAVLRSEAVDIADRLAAIEDQAKELRRLLANVAQLVRPGRILAVPLPDAVLKRLREGEDWSRLESAEIRSKWRDYAARLTTDADAKF